MRLFSPTDALTSTYDVPYSKDRPLLDAYLEPDVWNNALKNTFEIKNLNDYATPHVADFTIFLLGTSYGLYGAIEITLYDPIGLNGLFTTIAWDTDNSQLIDSNDDLIWVDVSYNGSAALSGQILSGSQFHNTSLSMVRNANVTENGYLGYTHSFVMEFFNPRIISNSTINNFGVDFGILYFSQTDNTNSGAQWTYLIESGDRSANREFMDPSTYNGALFAKLTLVASLNTDFYPPKINFLAPVNSINGIYLLKVYVYDASTITSVGFSQDIGETFQNMSENGTDPGMYSISWNSIGYVSEYLIFRSQDNFGNTGQLYVYTEASIADSSIVFTSVVLDNTAPTIVLKNPTEGDRISGPVIIQVEVHDLSPILAVKWRIGDLVWEDMTFNSAGNIWEAEWDTTTNSDGLYVLSFMAEDALGQSSTLQLNMMQSVNPMPNTITEQIGITITETTIKTKEGSLNLSFIVFTFSISMIILIKKGRRIA